MASNHYLDTNIQKAIQSCIPGCEKHQVKLAFVVNDANQHQRSLTIAWLDLSNAYGSIRHQHIQFALSHYHVPPEFLALVSNLCENQQAVITCTQLETKPVDLSVAVFQGNPLSFSIFNTAINLLLDLIQTVCPDAGYHFSASARKLPILYYADDACLIAKNAKECQQMIHATEVWLDWARMKPKVSKCRALGLQSGTARSSHFFNPQLSLF